MPTPIDNLDSFQEASLTKRLSLIDWFLRLIKGTLIGIGAILPGLSGGVMMVIFGIYEPLLRFIANIRVNFIKNMRFFIPVGIGMALGIVGFSAVVEYAFDHYAAQFIWLFIGFISGTFPSLFKTAGKFGRKPFHWVFLVVIAVGTFYFMHWMETVKSVSMTPSLGAWILSGVLIGLGVVVPGMSPSNFLIYLNLYPAMASGIRQLDFGVIIPLAVGVILCIFALAKLVSWLFNKAYTFMYHFILAVVIGSTLAIIPSGVSGWTIVVCAILFFAGAAGAYAFSKLEEKTPRESLF
ncbi:MAG: DUF368 domain-containing protein [Chloroflexi bacterium 44-23]|nr:MAG: DUF368 domain-containing protein [Chloroflexi bacterium 44-23]